MLAVGLGVGWQVAVPRGILEGLHRFKPLAVNLALDPTLRVGALVALLVGGYAISGAIAALALGLAGALFVGIYSLPATWSDTEPSPLVWSKLPSSLLPAASIP